MTTRAEKAIHYGQAYDLILGAITHLEAARDMDTPLPGDMVFHNAPYHCARDLRDMVLKLLTENLAPCGLDEIEEARIKITGK